MKIKKILAAIAACAMSVAMVGMTASAAGVEADVDVLDEEVEGEEIDFGEEEEEEETEPAPVVTEAVTEAPTVAAPNPVTGNSPIALAVIPVALAAAAVVAKKAK